VLSKVAVASASVKGLGRWKVTIVTIRGRLPDDRRKARKI